MANSRIRVGVVGLWRGMSFVNMAPHVEMELAALCDIRETELKRISAELGVPGYTDFDRFLEHDLDAVILANYCHEHAPLAIRALDSGRHVLSEVIACKTLAEGVALARAVERSGCVYMLAENYCYMAYVQEMRRLYRAGEVGEMQFGECEYMHPCTAHTLNWLAPGLNHWRNHKPSTYYPTHALGPIMYVTETMPVAVNARAILFFAGDCERLHVRRNDQAAVILCQMDNGALVTVNGILLRGHGNWYRIHGTRGLMENLRSHGNQDKLRVAHEPWDMEDGDVQERIYRPEFPEQRERAQAAGHGGGDFFTSWHFMRAIREGRPPWLDVYRGLAMSVVGIQAWRSCLSGGAPQEIPDFRDETVRAVHENDHWSPFPEDAGPGQPPPSIRGFIEPDADQIAAARAIWREMGYDS